MPVTYEQYQAKLQRLSELERRLAALRVQVTNKVRPEFQLQRATPDVQPKEPSSPTDIFTKRTQPLQDALGIDLTPEKTPTGGVGLDMESARNAGRFVVASGIGTLELARKFFTPSLQDKADALKEIEAMLPNIRGDVRSSLGEVLGPIYDAVAAPLGDRSASERLAQSGGLGPAASAASIVAPFTARAGKPLRAAQETVKQTKGVGELRSEIFKRADQQYEGIVERELADAAKSPRVGGSLPLRPEYVGDIQKLSRKDKPTVVGGSDATTAAIKSLDDTSLRNEALTLLGEEQAPRIASMNRGQLESVVSGGRIGAEVTQPPIKPKQASNAPLLQAEINAGLVKEKIKKVVRPVDQINEVIEKIDPRMKQAEQAATNVKKRIAAIADKPLAHREKIASVTDPEALLERPSVEMELIRQRTSGSSPSLSSVIDKHVAALDAEQAQIQMAGGGLGAVSTGRGRSVIPRVLTEYTEEAVKGPEGPVRDFFDRTEKPSNNIAESLWQKFRGEVRRRFIPYESLREPTAKHKEFFADARNELRILQDVGQMSLRRSLDGMKGVVGSLNRNQVDILRRKVFVEDLLETIERGKEVPEGLTKENLLAEKSRVDGILQSDQQVSVAYSRHKELWDAVQKDLIGRGKLREADAYKNYVHHDVLAYFNEFGTGTPAKLRSPIRRYLNKRKGSSEDILTDYLGVSYRSLSRVMRDNAIDDGLIRIAERYNDPSRPDGYVAWHPGISIESGPTVTGRMSAKMIEQLLAEMPEDVRAGVAEMIAESPETAGGYGQTLYIPEQLAKVMEDFRAHSKAPTGGLLPAITRGFKQLVLNKNPIRYNRRNMIGDFERALHVMPKAFVGDGAKMLKQTIKETVAGARGKYSEDYQLAVDNAVVGVGEIAREIGELQTLPEFQHIAHGKYQSLRHPVRTVGSALREVSTTRENLLRLHLFKYNLDRIRRGLPLEHGISDIRGITDPVKAAGRIAREALGDYGSLTPYEMNLRQGILPFYSWLKINTSFWPQLFLRKGSVPAVAYGFTRGMTYGARKIAQAGAVYVAASLYNNTQHPEQEAGLPEDVRNRFHINTGMKNDKGEWITYTDPTALSDFLQTIGVEGMSDDLSQLLRGRLTVGDFIEERVKAPVNAVAQRVTPLIKAPVEALSGRSFFPDVFEPRTQERGVDALVGASGFKEFLDPDEFGKYLKGFQPPQIYGATEQSPNKAAIFDSYRLAKEFVKKQGYTDEGYKEGPSTQKKRDLFNALVDKDIEKAKEIAVGLNPKEFREYIENRNPQRIVPKKFSVMFLAQLTEAERKELARAQAYLKQIEAEYNALVLGLKP